MEKLIRGEKAMEIVAREILEGLTVLSSGASIVGLSGDLGAGKTTLVRAIARALGVTEEVHSPTFVIAKFYPLTKHCDFSQLIHIDAYRIENPEELRALRWKELIVNPKNLIFIEWPEQLKEEFPANAKLLKLRFIDEETRSIEW